VKGPFYNGWYNKDITVSLNCSDWPIFGKGLDWSFGCGSTYYCIGEGCSGNLSAIKNYTAFFPLAETSYVSYYSVDKGGNAEPWIEDVLFQIDKSPPVFNISIRLIDTPIDVVLINTVYKVVVRGDKPFITSSISIPQMSYTSVPAKLKGSIQLFPTDDPYVYEGVLFLNNTNAYKGFEGTMTFIATGTDDHNLTGTSSYTIAVDTKPPEQPLLVPSLDKPSQAKSDYQTLGYPINFVDGVYYTNASSLFLTGKTTESTVLSAVVGVDGIDTAYTYIQTGNDVTFQDVALLGFEKSSELKVNGDISGSVDVNKFFGFDKEVKDIGPRKDYGSYGKFYDITGIGYIGGDEDYTSLTVSPVLQEFVKLDRDLVFYGKDHPSLWFGIDVPIVPFKNNLFYLKAVDKVGNLIRYPLTSDSPSRLTFFSDPIAPRVMDRFPMSGSTSRTTFDITVTVREGRDESGVYNNSINFTVNGAPVKYIMTHDAALEAIDASSQYFMISYPAVNLKNGIYTIRVTGTDKARNPFDQSDLASEWSFFVDDNIPYEPEFSLIDGFPAEFGPDRWYARSSPDFVLDFTNEIAPVTLVDISMMDSPTAGEAAACVNSSFNVFTCKFKEPKTSSGSTWADYGVIAKAYKTLTDGTKSHTGNWTFEFTVDDQPPLFNFTPRDSPSMNSRMRLRFMDNINLTLFAAVMNEHHPLKADIEILGKHYTPYYSPNNGEFYDFIWPVPDYQSAEEGYADLTLTLSDFAHNSQSVTRQVYIDLTAPRLEDINVEYSSNTVNIGGEMFTGGNRITVTGNFIDEDIETVWTVPGNYDNTTGITEGKAFGELIYDGKVPISFIVNVSLPNPEVGKKESAFLYNEMLINSINNMTLYVRDTAGHESSKKLRVIRDYTPPMDPMFCVGEDAENCGSD
jgi:hypothetical protein